MGTKFPLQLNTPPELRIIEVDVPLLPGQPPTTVQVLADSPEDAYRILYETGRGVGGAGGRSLYYGSVLEPIREVDEPSRIS